MKFVIEAFTKRGFPYKVSFELWKDTSLPLPGTIEFFNVSLRCFAGYVLIDPQTGEFAFMAKIYWSDLTPYIRETYGLKPGLSLYLSLPTEKVLQVEAFLAQEEPDMVFFPLSRVA